MANGRESGTWALGAAAVGPPQTFRPRPPLAALASSSLKGGVGSHHRFGRSLLGWQHCAAGSCGSSQSRARVRCSKPSLCEKPEDGLSLTANPLCTGHCSGCARGCCQPLPSGTL